MWTEPRCVPGPHLLLLQPPQGVTDVFDVLGGQSHQGCVASPQIHELEREKGNRGEKRGASVLLVDVERHPSQNMTWMQHLCLGNPPRHLEDPGWH